MGLENLGAAVYQREFLSSRGGLINAFDNEAALRSSWHSMSAVSQEPGVAARRVHEQEFIPSPRLLFGILAAYFGAQVALRCWISSSVDLDESEQVMLSQLASWGYSSDPPLYQWIQIGFFKAFGVSVLGLALFKNLLLAFTYWCTYETVRRITRSQMCGVAATLGLLFMPSVVWESQRDLTHSVLAAALSAATLLVLVRLQETRGTLWYILLGICGGLGILSKFNYPFFFLGILLAAATIPGTRAAVLDWRMLVTLALVCLIFLPNGLWMLSHPDLALLTSSKFKVAQSSNWLSGVLRGFGALAKAMVTFIGPTAVVYWLLFVKRGSKITHDLPGKDYVVLLARGWMIIAAALVLIVVATQASGFKERWFQPIFIGLPVISIVFLRNQLEPEMVARAFKLGVLVLLFVPSALGARVLFAERMGREEPLDRPYRELAEKVRQHTGPDVLLVADTVLLAGNLKLHFPETRTTSTEFYQLLRDGNRTVYVIWDATGKSAVPEGAVRWAHSNDFHRISEPTYVEAPYQYSPTRKHSLGLVKVSPK